MSGPVARPVILLSNRFAPVLDAALRAQYEAIGPLGKPLAGSVAALPAAQRAEIRALVTLGTTPVGQDVIDLLPALGAIVCMGSGYERVDLAAARARGIVVAHSPGANAASVADLAIGLMIASVRGMFRANAYLQRGDWSRRVKRQLGGPGLTGRRIGIYGLGAIGAKIAVRAAAMEMEVGYCNRRRRDDVPYAYFPTLPALAAWSDVLMIAVRADDTNRHAVDADVLHALGPGGHVVNIARGSVIGEAALVAALESGGIAGAGLDVFETEPDVPEALLNHPGVALTPHIGGDTEDAAAAMAAMVMANLEAYFAGCDVPHPVPAGQEG